MGISRQGKADGRRVTKRLSPLVLVLAMLVLSACGGDSKSDSKPVGGDNKGSLGPETTLVLTYDAGKGKKQVAKLTCAGPDVNGTGYLADRAPEACQQVVSLKGPIAGADERQACAAVYGGPETLRIAGRLDFETVNHLFKQTDSCQIATWRRLSPLLPN